MSSGDSSGVLLLVRLAVFVVVMAGLIYLVNLVKNDSFNKGVLAHHNGTYVVQTNLDGSQTVFAKDDVKVVP